MKKAAVINDLSGFGKCSLSAAMAVLSVCGVQPCAVPTAILTNQTGYPKFQCVDFTAHMRAYIDIWKSAHAEFDGIYSGYIANEAQIGFISDFINEFKTEKTLVLVDPVMGDNGRVYGGYSSDMCRKMAMLTNKADMITPNLTELCILAQKDYGAVSRLALEEKAACIEEMAHGLIEQGCRTVAVTGVVESAFVYNYVFTESEKFSCRSEYYGTGFSGTGDLFASAIFAKTLCGESMETALNTAVEFIGRSVADTVKNRDFDPNDGVEFEKNLMYLKERC